MRILGIILNCLGRQAVGERESYVKREDLIGWLEEVARQLGTGMLMVDGEKIAVPEEVRSRIKTKDKKGCSSLKLYLEWETKAARKKDKRTRKVVPNNGEKIEQEPETGATVRDYDSHVLVCMGGDCKKRGSKSVRKALKNEVRASGILGDVRLDTVDCLGLCEHGPNVVVYPEETWYLGLKEAHIPEVVEQHLKSGAPVERLAAKRRPRRAKKVKK